MKKMFSSQRFIYIALLIVLAIPLICKNAMKAARVLSAESAFNLVEKQDAGIILIGMEYGPGTQAENDSQAKIFIEHIFRKKLKAVFFTTYPLAEGYTVETPKNVAKLVSQETGREVKYGEDWIVVGFRPGSQMYLQSMAQSTQLSDFLGKDINGKPVSEYQNFKDLKTIRDFKIVANFSGLVGILNNYIQYLQSGKELTPMIHGCTSISIPETFIYSDSGQLNGVFEGIVGAAWYAELIKQKYHTTIKSDAAVINTALGFAQIFIVLLIVLGNIIEYWPVKYIPGKGAKK